MSQLVERVDVVLLPSHHSYRVEAQTWYVERVGIVFQPSHHSYRGKAGTWGNVLPLTTLPLLIDYVKSSMLDVVLNSQTGCYLFRRQNSASRRTSEVLDA